MFCCCPQDTEIITSESIKKTSSGEDKIQTGKGIVSSHTNQTVAADLKKSTVQTQETLPIVKQPSKDTRDLSSTKPTSQVSDPAEVSISIDEKVGSSAKPIVESNTALTTKATETTVASMLDPAKLNIISSEIDKLDKAISESKAKSDWELKSNIVPNLANQLKVLTSQVAGQLKNMAEKDLQAVVSRLEAVATRLESLASRSSASSLDNSAASDALSPFVLAYDDLISGPLAKYLSLSNLVGGDVKTQANLVKLAFEAQRNFLAVVSRSKQPDQNVFLELLRPSADKLQAVQDFREKNRKSEYFNHLSAISESIASLGWVTVSPAPGPYVKEMLDAGTFYTNRVLKDFKEKDPNHVEWSRSWIATLTELQGYIKQYHTTGLSWNPKHGEPKHPEDQRDQYTVTSLQVKVHLPEAAPEEVDSTRRSPTVTHSTVTHIFKSTCSDTEIVNN
ncbi:F-actin-capping protein subunit beta [Bulinus truncatus]|nr:F-actin-capping protein subunit beta [Bulinus truncatus]